MITKQRRMKLAGDLRSLAQSPDVDRRDVPTLLDAAMVLEHDAGEMDFEERLSELERWQRGFDAEWSETSLAFNEFEKRIENIETQTDR